MNTGRIRTVLKQSVSVFLALWCLFPFVWMIFISLSRYPDVTAPGVPFIPTFIHYKEILTNPSLHFLSYLVNSVVISLVSSAASTALASLTAYAVSRLKFPGRTVVPMTLLAFSMFPHISISGSVFTLIVSLSLFNTYTGLIIPYSALALPLALWILLNYFSGISRELDDAALIDGASRFQIFRKIILPLALPGIASAFLLTFIFSFNEFMFALMLTNDHAARTVPVGIALFEGLHGQIPWGYVMAAAVIAIIPVIFIVVAFQRFIVHGLIRGALKG